MCNADLISLIYRYRKSRDENFEDIYMVFKNLIYIYGYRLKNSEDAIQDLNLFLIKMLNTIRLDKFSADSSSELHKYIAVSIRNKYIKISKIHQHYTKISADYSEELFPCQDSVEEHIVLKEAISFLTEKQLKVIIYKYFYGYSNTEIADMLHIKRQTVGKIKNNALSTLRHLLLDKQP